MTQPTDHNEDQPMVMMQPADHLQIALEFLDEADREFAEGQERQACEKLWGATAQVMIAAAKQRGWPHRSHRAMRETAEGLAEEYGDERIGLRFMVAEKFHRRFYNEIAPEFEVQGDRPVIRRFVEDLCARLAANGAATPGG